MKKILPLRLDTIIKNWVSYKLEATGKNDPVDLKIKSDFPPDLNDMDSLLDLSNKE